MNTFSHQELIRAVVTDFIEKLGFSATVEVTSPVVPETTYICSVSVEDGQNFLIGQYGVNLAALQHLVRILVRRRSQEKLDIIVDINNYFSEKKQLVEKEASLALEEVFQKNISVALRPMLPYERKIVHAFLAKNSNVVTESIGTGDDRKVMIRPVLKA